MKHDIFFAYAFERALESVLEKSPIDSRSHTLTKEAFELFLLEAGGTASFERFAPSVRSFGNGRFEVRIDVTVYKKRYWRVRGAAQSMQKLLARHNVKATVRVRQSQNL
ncbi:MAG: hypothetical protein OYG31_02110 [Candidatus Kaiserbacteria bacterium]|nr:hypothetical protein [Candidatus Kaiserbacteria bacterium]